MDKRTVTERLYSQIKDYQTKLEQSQCILSSTIQDMDYLLEELEQMIDQERYHNG